MEELLPCPFCGCEVTMSDLDDEDDRRMWVRYIECDVCELKMRDWAGFPGKGIPFDRVKLSEQVGKSLAKMWNHRFGRVKAYAVLDMSGEGFHSIHETKEEAKQGARFLGTAVPVYYETK